MKAPDRRTGEPKMSMKEAIERTMRNEHVPSEMQPRCKSCGHKIAYGLGQWVHTNIPESETHHQAEPAMTSSTGAYTDLRELEAEIKETLWFHDEEAPDSNNECAVCGIIVEKHYDTKAGFVLCVVCARAQIDGIKIDHHDAEQAKEAGKIRAKAKFTKTKDGFTVTLTSNQWYRLMSICGVKLAGNALAELSQEESR